MSETTSPRLHVVDALRGFAILSIMLLHNIEHFDFYFSPTNLPVWMPAVDKGIWETLFFLFGGKSYAIFALLFGLTFFIQSNNQEKKGNDFSGRFAWRLLLLLGFGFINSAFYQGDILTIYALIGFTLIPVAKLSNKSVFIIAIILMVQPYEWLNVISGMQHPDLKMANPASWAYFGKLGEYIPGDSIIKTWIGNLTNGKTAVLLWTWEAGRVFQTSALFMLGMLAGRKKLFVPSDTNTRFWIRTLVIATLAFIPLFILKNDLDRQDEFRSGRIVELNFHKDSYSLDGSNNFSASSKTYFKNAVLFSIFFASLELKFFRYPRFILCDNMEDKGMEKVRTQNFQNLITSMSKKFGDDHQIIFTTSMIADELNDTPYCVGKNYDRGNKTLHV